MNDSGREFGPPDKHLRETLERELGEVPPDAPSEQSDEAAAHDGDERDDREQDVREHAGGELRVDGPRSTSADDTAALLEAAEVSIEAVGAHEELADGPGEDEPHPPLGKDNLLERGPATSSDSLYETEESVERGPLAPTPAPTNTWLAPLQGKGGFPADAQIAVSTTHVIVTNRQRIRYYDKNGSPLGSDFGSTGFFTAGINLKDAAGNPIDFFNDLRVIFDAYRKRFWITAYARFSGAKNVPADKRRFFIAIAVSKTENPLDGWHFFSLSGVTEQGVPNSQIWQPGDAPDYPIIGIDKLAVTIAHVVKNAGSFRYWRVTLSPADPLANGQAQAGWQFWDLKNPDGTPPSVIAPAVHHGSAKGGRAYWLGRQGSDSIVVWAITNPFDAARKLEKVAVKMLTPFSTPVDGQQKGSSKLIKMTNLGNAVVSASFRNETVHGVTNDAHDWGGIGKSRTSIHYFRLPVSGWPKVPSPPGGGGVDRLFGGGNVNEKIGGLKYYGWPAVEVNKDGNAIIGYARTGEQLYPEVRASAYMAAEGDIRPSRQVKAGDTFADNPNSSYASATAVLPWGDTSGACVDPADDTAIWIAQEYASKTASNNGNYDIWVASFFGQ